MKAIFGLGNPGREYDQTKHNMGFMTIDALADTYQVELNKSEFSAIDTHFKLAGETIYLVKPLTFMNSSGNAVKQLMSYYQIRPEEILVIQDDLDLPIGKIRLREKGSAGGHNGIKSIIAATGTQDFKRVKIGIGHPDRAQVVNWVLTPFQKAEQANAQAGIGLAAQAIQKWLETDNFSQVMNDFN
ncbi:aminoacyl-tRNA hydrolase [Bombilactobacillus folatiphilus]|uniref:Peptidyl-tRNA hydrolase n=1 Tax=Bombilactobacillus folatiphilus TaxID=2923362 RepID=A0ABY4P9M8_9LACO|nr:aminoacyl-tRNA hydrolase [Bombilactobacillus folatiphilus]UQS82331.1 aminoacyl-tRNA hydrolase [Bombilactobacillus folatiphilus]